MKIAIISLIILTQLGCRNKSEELFSQKLSNLQNKEISIDATEKTKAMVLLFLVPDCPFSQFYSMAINQIYSNYYNKGYQFYGIVPGNLYANSEIINFKKNNDFKPEIVIDKFYHLTKNYKVNVVPTALVLNSHGKALYFGKIDDQAIQAGQKKHIATSFYLLDALKAIENKKEISIKKTIPVGCYIE